VQRLDKRTNTNSTSFSDNGQNCTKLLFYYFIIYKIIIYNNFKKASGYVDNTLVMAKGDTVDAVQQRANVVLETISDHIRGLGLRLSADKTQAVVFTRHYEATKTLILLEGEVVRLGKS